MHKKIVLIAVIAIFIIGAFSTFIFQQTTVKTNNEKPKIAATIFPLYDITRNIAGDDIDTVLILPSGASPHTYDPTPNDIRRLQNAKAVYAIGYGVDSWAKTIADGVSADTVIVADNIALLADQKNQDAYNPHYWLSINNAEQIAKNIADDLSQRFPDQADVFNSNLTKYLTQLQNTQSQLQNILSNLDNNKIITMHDAWNYFADEYNLEVIGTFEPSAGIEPSPQDIATLNSLVKENNIKVIYSEPQLDVSGLEAFMKDNQINLSILDPLGGDEEKNSYINLMLYNAQTIANNQ
ncbi:zinc ABC transporter substrate-binding protein [Candidatus Parcubacteria bacterium]|nr:MAG: zinc ABC transporter substrate-binding protein [Candidatus Parcubacteria bacterium]